VKKIGRRLAKEMKKTKKLRRGDGEEGKAEAEPNLSAWTPKSKSLLHLYSVVPWASRSALSISM
jgi:hypothetical protein